MLKYLITARGGAAWSGACPPRSRRMNVFTFTQTWGTMAPPSGENSEKSKLAKKKLINN